MSPPSTDHTVYHEIFMLQGISFNCTFASPLSLSKVVHMTPGWRGSLGPRIRLCGERCSQTEVVLHREISKGKCFDLKLSGNEFYYTA